MANHTLKTLARFPFMTEASKYIKSLDLSIDNIMESIAYSSAWTRGKQRLNEALDHGEIKEHGSTSEAEYINELLSYVIARIMVSCIRDSYLVRRYALAEAVYAYKDLENQDLRFISEVAKQFEFDSIDIVDAEIELSIADYLKYSINLRDPEQKWKLINRDVKDGNVTLSGQAMARLIQEAIKDKIQTELPIEVDPELKQKITPKIRDLIETVKTRKRKFEARDLGKVTIVRFPPCMKQLLGMTQAGENVSHVGRFAMASFLHHIGLSTDQILSVFGTSPDFDVSKARYQIEHITGKISGTEYTPPNCDTMKSNSVCINPDSLCNREWMNHPLTYYRIKGKPQKYAKKKTNAQEKNSD